MWTLLHRNAERAVAPAEFWTGVRCVSSANREKEAARWLLKAASVGDSMIKSMGISSMRGEWMRVDGEPNATLVALAVAGREQAQ